MLRRTTLPGLAALTLACGAAITATAVSATAVSATAGSIVKTTAARTVTETSGHSPATGSVLGMFEMKGGPVKPGAKGGTPAQPLSGVIMFRDKKGHTTDVTAGQNGHFAGKLPAGTYTVTARSPQIRQQNPNGTYSDPPCAGPVTAVMRTGHTTDLTLVCYVP
jgi:hypothetical protein